MILITDKQEWHLYKSTVNVPFLFFFFFFSAKISDIPIRPSSFSTTAKPNWNELFLEIEVSISYREEERTGERGERAG